MKNLNKEVEWLARVETQKMTDGSTAFNVVLSVDGELTRLACETGEHAFDLMKNINNCSYAEAIGRRAPFASIQQNGDRG